jgi:hypothetical protein
LERSSLDGKRKKPMRLFYTDRAIDDVELAFSWYEEQRMGLGYEFIDCIEQSVINNRQNPDKRP